MAQQGESRRVVRQREGRLLQEFAGDDLPDLRRQELYPSIEEKAANLLYFIVKNHSFTDGNKRIAAAIFVWFLERQGFLYNAEGEKRIADNALVAFTLLIAESKQDEREIMVKVIINLINGKNA